MADILPSGGGRALINVDDTALLLLDHQDGLFLTVKDITVAELRANVIALARIATLLKVPIITTASVPDGPNGRGILIACKFSFDKVIYRRRGNVVDAIIRL